MMSLKMIRGCNYKAFLLTLLSILGLLEIMTKYNNEYSDLASNKATGSFHNLSNKMLRTEENDVSSKTAKSKILLLAYARSGHYRFVFKLVTMLAHFRSGSSFTGELLSALPTAAYYYEPLYSLRCKLSTIP